jgi:translation initiation factor IF-3
VEKDSVSRFKDRKPKREEVYINERIRGTRMRVITETGDNLGEISRAEALSRANDSSLDLVQIGMEGEVPITKIMDFGRQLYLKKKQQGEAKKKQKVIIIKEVKLRPNIGDEDYNTKLNRAFKFLDEGKRVKFTLQFRGRERATMGETAPKFFDRIRKNVVAQELGTLIEEKESRGGPFWSKIVYIKEK